MARHVHRLPRFLLTAQTDVQNPISFPLSHSLCSASAPENPTETTLTEIQNPSTNVEDQHRHEQVRKLRVFLQQGRTESAQRLSKSLVLSKAPFSSPSELFTLFAVSAPSMMRTFSDMLLAVCSESRMTTEAMELYRLMKRDGRFPSLASFNVLLESLVASKQFQIALELVSDVLGSGIRLDRFAFGKAVLAAVKLGDLNRAFELLDIMKKSSVSPNVFVYNVVLGGLCKEKRMRDAEKVFDEMLKRKLVPSLVTYNTMIDGYCKVGELEGAFGFRVRMKVENVEPT